jgi:hypothetical protein
MKADPRLEQQIKSTYPDLWQHVQPNNSGKFSSKSPTDAGFTWHHALSDQVHGKKGVMQLVDHGDHSANHGPYHPPGFGGCRDWGGGCK